MVAECSIKSGLEGIVVLIQNVSQIPFVIVRAWYRVILVVVVTITITSTNTAKQRLCGSVDARLSIASLFVGEGEPASCLLSEGEALG